MKFHCSTNCTDASRHPESSISGSVRQGLAACLIVAALVLPPPQRAVAEPAPANRLALDAIFADEHVRDSAQDVHQRAMTLASAARYDFLAAWILPGPGHNSLRMPVGFSPTNPAPSASHGIPATSAAAIRRRVSTGGELISPVFDLLDVATELDRLDNLRARIRSWNTSGKRTDEVCRFAMLTLIDIASGDDASAHDHLERMLKISLEGVTVDTPPTSAELLVFQRGPERPSLREALAGALDRYMAWARSGYMRAAPKTHVAAMASRVRASQVPPAEAATLISVRPMQRWFPVSRTTAESRGRGFPAARWNFRRGQVENVASHDDDYLYFAIPLRGNYEVECDVHGFGWRDSNLRVAGTWVAPLYRLNTYEIGYFHRTDTRPKIVPPLTKVDTWIHYRTVVRDGTATTYFNGRSIHEARLSVDHDPWLAVRSMRQHNGGVRNLRITGQPIIPQELRLPTDDGLRDWLPYFESTKGGYRDNRWRSVRNAGDSSEIIGLRISRETESTEPQVTADHERLLRYHRPMLEDGTISYEFFYVPGQVHVHPALDRLAFLLRPEGVRIHWITDGPHERTTLAADNVFDESDHRRGPDSLPLLVNNWNRLQLSLTGDVVELRLNDELIYHRPLEPTNQRTFGLFHYADQGFARVRNIVWRGDWPRTLPTIAEQELADDGTDFLDESLEHLTATFRHDFVKDGFPAGKFGTSGGNPDNVAPTADGLLVTCPGGDGGYFNTTIASNLTVKGDFDIIASFERFEANPPAGGSGSICLRTILDNELRNECLILRRHLRHKTEPQLLVQPEYVSRQVEVVRRMRFGSEPVVEATSGRLRLARRGESVYYLFAEHDSPHFRLFGTQTAPPDDLVNGGVLLSTIAQERGATSVVWKDLTIRAESVTGMAVEDPVRLIAELNDQRAQLPVRFTYDFTRAEAFDEHFARKDDVPLPGDKGLQVVAPGTNNWTSVGVSTRNGLVGDFDIHVDLEVLKMDQPATGLRSDVFLQIGFADARESQVYILFTQEADGSLRVRDTVRQQANDGAVHYRTLNSVRSDTVSGFRIARRGTRVFFLFEPGGSEKETLISFDDITDADVPPGFVWFLAHTGGADRETRALWKHLDIQTAELLDSSPTAK